MNFIEINIEDQLYKENNIHSFQRFTGWVKRAISGIGYWEF